MRNLDDDPPIITLSAGPVDAYPVVLRALSRPVTYDFDPSFQQFYESTVLKTAESLRTTRPPVILQGEPVLGLEAAAAALIGADDVVLNLASGEYGKGFGFWAARHCRELVEIEVPYDDAIDPEAVSDMLKARPEIRILSVCHHDTPSGTVNPVREIGAICRAHDVLTIVDAVSSFGGMDVHPEDVNADIFVTSPSKCLGGSTGLCIVPRQRARLGENRRQPRRAHGLRAQPQGLAGRVASGRPVPVHAVGLRDPCAGRCRAELSRRGAGGGVGPPRADGARLPRRSPSHGARPLARARIHLRRYRDHGAGAGGPRGCGDPAGGAPALRRGLLAGRGSLLGKLVRIGHMGPVARPIYAVVAVTALGGAITALGGRADVGAGVEAVLAAIDAAE